jgi:hypothetical protein
MAAVLWLLLVGPSAAAPTVLELPQTTTGQPLNLAAQRAGRAAVGAWQPARKLLQPTALWPAPAPTSSSSSSGTWPWNWQPGSLLLPAVANTNSGSSGSGVGVNSWPAWSAVVRWADRNSTPPATTSSRTYNGSMQGPSTTTSSNQSSSQPRTPQREQQPVLTTVSQAPPVPLEPLPEPSRSVVGTLQDPGGKWDAWMWQWPARHIQNDTVSSSPGRRARKAVPRCEDLLPGAMIII